MGCGVPPALAYLAHIFGADVRVQRPLDDQQLTADILHKVDWGAFIISFGHLVRSSTHHLLAEWAQVGTGGVVIHHQVGHAADRSRSPDDFRWVMGDQEPGTITAIGRPGHANFPGLSQTSLNQVPAPQRQYLPARAHPNHLP